MVEGDGRLVTLNRSMAATRTLPHRPGLITGHGRRYTNQIELF